MAEMLALSDTADKATRYAELYPQLVALVGHETNYIANVANIVSALRMAFGFFWVGVYFIEGDTLVLGPFQGDIACTRIARGRGVCGSAWARAETIVVPDVERFDGHIACSSQSRSEVVVPIMRGGQVLGVLDVDSDQVADFCQADAQGLERIAELLASILP